MPSEKILKEILNYVKKTYIETKKRKNLQIFFGIISIGSFIFGILTILGIQTILNIFQKSQVFEYDISVSIQPDFIILNDESEKLYTFTFENTGLKNISGFNVNEIIFYREVDFQERFVYSSYSSSSRSYLNCPVFDRILERGEKCTLQVSFSCIKLCDDKDKIVGFLTYLRTIPPVTNKFVRLQIK